VKICSLYGAGFYYMPGTDTCIKIGGFVRAEVDVNAGGSFSVHQSGAFGGPADAGLQLWRTRAGVTLDTRSQTEYGTLRSYFVLAATSDFDGSGNTSLGTSASITGATAPGVVLSPGTYGGTGVGNNPGGAGRAPYTRQWSNAAFIQFAGFTAGKTGSFFDFDLQPYSNQTNFWSSNMAGGGITVFAYTAQFGNGLSASISAEDAAVRRQSITATNVVVPSAATPTLAQYGNVQSPDIVGNLRIDQAWGSAQVMGAYHQVFEVNQLTAAAAQTSTSATGYAFGAGLKFNVPMLGKGDYVLGQFTYSKGANQYAGSNMNGGFADTNSDATVAYAGQSFDAVVTPGGGLDLTTAWSVTAGYEHFWNSQWKTSLYGAYGQVSYSDAATAVIRPATAGAGTSANWDYWQVGSRTTWTPVANLDLSLEAMYNHLDGAYTSTATGAFGDHSWVSGIFRVQRNFYP